MQNGFVKVSSVPQIAKFGLRILPLSKGFIKKAQYQTIQQGQNYDLQVLQISQNKIIQDNSKFLPLPQLRDTIYCICSSQTVCEV